MYKGQQVKQGVRAGLSVWLVGGALASCAEFGSETDSAGPKSVPATGGATNGGSTSEPPFPSPEVELEESFLAPVVSGKYLWTANPETNKIARVMADTLAIEVLDAGHGPTYLAALPEGATEGGALVQNELSNDVSVFLRDGKTGLLDLDRIPVQEGASAWAVGDEGHYAIAWSRAADQDGSSGDGFQDLTVLSFDEQSVVATKLSVGFRPRRVVINHDESHAYVVSEPGISVIELGQEPQVVREIALQAPGGEAPRDVLFSAGGEVAYVAHEGSDQLLLVSTETGEKRSLTLPGSITDLDRSGDGSLLAAVVREAEGSAGEGGAGGASPGGSSVTLLDAQESIDEPMNQRQLVMDEVVGSVVLSADASRAVLFTNATDSTRVILLDIEARQQRVVDVRAPARAAFLSEEGNFGVVLMDRAAGSSQAGGFALLSLEQDLFPRIEGTKQPVQFVSLSAEARRALLTTEATSSAPAQTYFARFPSMQVDQVTLPSRPLASGLVPDVGRGFVAQEHPEGRISFFDLESGDSTTLTGFELASKVVR